MKSRALWQSPRGPEWPRVDMKSKRQCVSKHDEPWRVIEREREMDLMGLTEAGQDKRRVKVE